MVFSQATVDVQELGDNIIATTACHRAHTAQRQVGLSASLMGMSGGSGVCPLYRR